MAKCLFAHLLVYLGIHRFIEKNIYKMEIASKFSPMTIFRICVVIFVIVVVVFIITNFLATPSSQIQYTYAGDSKNANTDRLPNIDPAVLETADHASVWNSTRSTTDPTTTTESTSSSVYGEGLSVPLEISPAVRNKYENPNKAQSTRWKGQKHVYEIVRGMFNRNETIYTNYRDEHCPVNPETHRRLEYDIFIPNKRVAIEFNGEQHYKPVSVFGSGSNIQQFRRDQIKAQHAIANKIVLITIPYTMTDESEIRNYISTILMSHGISRT
jgi:hypothetical protein